MSLTVNKPRMGIRWIRRGHGRLSHSPSLAWRTGIIRSPTAAFKIASEEHARRVRLAWSLVAVTSVKEPRWTGTARVVSTRLTKEELSDIHRGISEIKAGKAKRFKTVGETIEWLNRKRD